MFMHIEANPDFCEATSCMEKGAELRQTREGLVNASSKTTEIYTRVSRKNIKQMSSLLDDLKI
jgi:integrase/recombinase XerD